MSLKVSINEDEFHQIRDWFLKSCMFEIYFKNLPWQYYSQLGILDEQTQ